MQHRRLRNKHYSCHALSSSGSLLEIARMQNGLRITQSPHKFYSLRAERLSPLFNGRIVFLNAHKTLARSKGCSAEHRHARGGKSSNTRDVTGLGQALFA